MDHRSHQCPRPCLKELMEYAHPDLTKKGEYISCSRLNNQPTYIPAPVGSIPHPEYGVDGLKYGSALA